MKDGQVKQVADPLTLYEDPNSQFCADFIGKINQLEAHVIGVEGKNLVVDIKGVGTTRIPCHGHAEGRVTLAVRPEKLQLSSDEPDNDCVKFLSRVDNVVYFGSTSHVFLKNAAGKHLMVEIRNRESDTATSILIGSKIWVFWKATDTLVLTQ